MKGWIVAAWTGGLCFVSGAEAAASSFVFTMIDAPGAASTDLVGINNAGTIVGNAGNRFQGFTYLGGVFTALTAPANAGVSGSLGAGGISNTGAVTGSALMAARSPVGMKEVGFVQTATSFQVLDLNSLATTPHGINSAGTVVGGVGSTFPSSFGPFIYSNGVATRGPAQVPDPAVPYSTITNRGINDAGDVVGTYTSSANEYTSFIVVNGITTKLVPPGVMPRFTLYAYGINNQDQVVGSLDNHAFFESMGSYVEFDVPGSTATMAEAINDAGDIVGSYVDGNGVTHGFLATPVPEPASATLLASGLLALLTRRRLRVRRR